MPEISTTVDRYIIERTDETSSDSLLVIWSNEIKLRRIILRVPSQQVALRVDQFVCFEPAVAVFVVAL